MDRSPDAPEPRSPDPLDSAAVPEAEDHDVTAPIAPVVRQRGA